MRALLAIATVGAVLGVVGALGACRPLVRANPCDNDDAAKDAFDLAQCHERQGVAAGGEGAFCRADADCAAHFKCVVRECTFFNTDPEAVLDEQLAATEDEPVVLDVLANDSDADGDALVIGAVSQGRNGVVTIEPGGAAVRYQPLPDTNGVDAFTYSVEDGNGGTRTGSVTLFVAPVNDAPELRTLSLVTNEETTATAQLVIEDVDDDPVIVDPVLVVPPQFGVAVVVSNALSYTPFLDYTGDDSVTLRISDGTTTVDSVVQLSTAPVNDAPVAVIVAPESPLLEESGTGFISAQFDASASFDVDGDELTFIWRIDGVGVEGGNDAVEDLVLTPGTHTVNVTVTDAVLVSADASVEITVVPTLLFVDANAGVGGDGLTWDDAFIDLQDALAFARTPGNFIRQVWVADGTYTPSPLSAVDLRASFELVAGVAVLGGFAGGETSVDQRDPATNVTVLSGDLFGDDTPGFGGRAENALHVVRATLVPPTTVLDGVTIRGGFARLVGGDCCEDRNGAAIVMTNASPTLRNLVVTDNLEEGGGLGGIVSAQDSGPLVDASLFIGNESGAQFGGIFLNNLGNATLRNSRFIGNTINGSFGTAATNVGVLTVEGCVFAGNVGASGVAGINPGHDVTVRFSTFLDGNGVQGAGDDSVTSSIFVNAAIDAGVAVSSSCTSAGAIAFVDADGADDVPFTADDDYTLAPGSCGRDEGDGAALPAELAVDVVGRARVSGVGVDAGAYEAP